MLYEVITRPTYLYWGVKQVDQLYEGEEVLGWTDEYPELTFVPVVEFPPEEWQGRTGMVHEAVQDDFASLDRITSYNVCYTKLLRELRNSAQIRHPWHPDPAVVQEWQRRGHQGRRPVQDPVERIPGRPS